MASDARARLEKPKRRWRRWIASAAALLVAGWLTSSLAVAYRLTVRAKPLYAEPPPQVNWGVFESIRLKTTDGEELGGWFMKGADSRPAVLLLHGNGADRSSCLEQAKLLRETGCSVLLVTMRAHGDSTGRRNDVGYSARFDAIAAVDYLTRVCPGAPIVVWGQSLGSAAAVFAAPLLSDQVQGYILECPYSDLRTTVRHRLELYLPPVAREIAHAGLLTAAPLLLPELDQISPLRASADVPAHAHVLILAGGLDRRATPQEATAIRKRLGDRAKLVVFDRAGHLDLFHSDPALYRKSILKFVNSFVGAASPGKVH
jgi:alpha-beta hydrolase superfamily lysophospholipase